MPCRLAVLAIAFAFLGGASAHAADRTDFFAAQLKRSPVFVSDSIERRVDAADRATLLREVEAMPFPTYVVVAPDMGVSEGVYGEDRLALLRDALGQDGLYVFSNDRGSIDVAAYGVRPKLRTHDINMASYYDLDRDEPTIKKLEYALALARGEPRLPKAQRAVIPTFEGGPEPTPYEERDDEPASLALPAIAVFLLGAGLSATGLERRYRRRKARGRRRAGSSPAADVRTRAVNAREQLARDIGRRRAPDERALDLEVAASMALARKPSAMNDLGALVLAQRGKEALSGKERERCFFDPRHTGWAKPTRWQADRGSIDVPACAKCAKAIAVGKAPDSLWDGDRPYWQRDTVWARTGFGALRRDMRRALAEDGR